MKKEIISIQRFGMPLSARNGDVKVQPHGKDHATKIVRIPDGQMLEFKELRFERIEYQGKKYIQAVMAQAELSVVLTKKQIRSLFSDVDLEELLDELSDDNVYPI